MTTRLVHIGIHESRNENAGDTLLFPLVRRCLELMGPIEWVKRQLWEPFGVDDAIALEGVVDGVVVGGGGLLLRDQAGAEGSASGWQWNATVDAVAALPVPLVVFAIGYNRFRGQPEFDPPFTEHIRTVVERSTFFGLRNTGSIRAVERYLPPALHDRLQFQPCPTTILSRLDPDAMTGRPARADGRPVLALNVAFDRSELRFGADADAALQAVASAAAAAAGRGWALKYVAHKSLDLAFLEVLERNGLSVEVDDVSSRGPEAVIRAYVDCDLALGARGHAQMIPFGLGRPIVSFVSHDKMAWFLEDIGHPEWGVEMSDPDLTAKLDAAIRTVEDHPQHVAESLVRAQDMLWERTQANLGFLKAALPSFDADGTS